MSNDRPVPGAREWRDELLAAEGGTKLADLPATAWDRLARLAAASPLYAQELRRHPAGAAWVTHPDNEATEFRFRALRDEWQQMAADRALDPGTAPLPDRLEALRAYRRKISLRIAYREVNALASAETTVGELSRLAEFCLQKCLDWASAQWTVRLGVPWDEDLDRPARLGVLALGKLGGGELNFSSDIDLLFFYEGEGYARRDGGATSRANVEVFTKIVEDTATFLQQQTGEGFLFRVDLRLRPEGDAGPLVRSFGELENYYAAAGQTWERLALIKARPVAGDRALGAELLESLHAFRYPRHPPPSMLMEVAAMKARTEREIVGADALHLDIKSGHGGIREIEFMVQCLQLMHAGRFPFLQTTSTAAALQQLARYELLPRADTEFYREAYWFLRAVEHRIQMREERQTHQLPRDPAELAAMATTLGLVSGEALRARLDEIRDRVHARFREWFAGSDDASEFNDWWALLTRGERSAAIATRLAAWFRDDPDAAEQLVLFVRGDRTHVVTRELVVRFAELARNFDALLPTLAQPLETLRRLAQFAETYGSRQQFFNACAVNPPLLGVLARLFDRSQFIFEVLRQNPGIFEEVLRPEILRKVKDVDALRAELAAGEAAADFADWLWHYVKAEQIRLAIGELLEFVTPVELEERLSLLADAVLSHGLRRVDPAGRLLLIALGKYGGRELTFGSDLDLLLVGAGDDTSADEPRWRALERLVGQHGPLGGAFALDWRLRPHGDAGPRITTLPALRAYHAGGGAQVWEKQLLTRARVVAGAPALAQEWAAWLAGLLYGAPATAAEEQAMWAMRLRIERERDRVDPPERALKTGAGGLIDIEFAAQLLQLRHGAAQPALRSPGTRRGLAALGGLGILPADTAARLRASFDFLKRIELSLRRDTARPVSVLGEAGAQERLARWLGYASRELFWADYTRHLADTRALVRAALGPHIAG
jgi:glutamate-ammonia-ligase adenylyltransferase